MPKQFNLYAESYKSFFKSCEDAGLVIDGEIACSSKDYCLDLIGELRKPTGKTLTDDEGFKYPETKPIKGYHANLITRVKLGIEHLHVDVKTPQVLFAGVKND